MKLNFSKIGLGTAQFGMSYGISNKTGQISPSEVQNILKLSRKEKIDVLDSASAYGNAEQILGQNNIDGFKMVSKFMPPSATGMIKEQLNRSLKNLRLSSLYAYLAHRPLKILEQPWQWEELKNCREEGKVKKIGYSLNEFRELEQLLQKGYIPDLIQVPYNYFDRRFENSILKLKKTGCEIHTRSTFLQGLFFMKPEKLDPFFNEICPLLKELQKIPLLNGALLQFVLEKPFIDKVIIGVENEQQLKQNLKEIKNAPVLPQLNKTISKEIIIPSRWPKK